jgi:hypothetical protein
MSFGETSPPVVRHLLVCRRVTFDLSAPGAAYSLHGLITQLQLEAGAEFPIAVPELWAFLQVFGDAGEYEIWIELVAVDGEGEAVGEATSDGPFVLRVPDEAWLVESRVPFGERLGPSVRVARGARVVRGTCSRAKSFLSEGTHRAGTRKRYRPGMVADNFEMVELHPTAHPTEEQKKWPVVKLRKPARFGVEFQLVLHLTGAPLTGLAFDVVLEVGRALNGAEVALGGGGLLLTGKRTDARTATLDLEASRAEGAPERLAQLAARLGSGELVLTASPLVAKCELVLPRAA